MRPGGEGSIASMLMSIATVSISGSLDAKLRAIHDARFQGVEIFENDLLSFGGSAPEVGALMRDLGLTCTCFQPFRDFEGMPEPQRRRAFERAERKFDLMHELGASLLLVCSSVSPASSNDRGRIVDDFRPRSLLEAGDTLEHTSNKDA